MLGVGCGGGSDLGPELEGFHSGGFQGAACPPASTTNESCSDPDCGVACRANTVCDPGAPECPAGYDCDDSIETPYCLPGATCDVAADCAEGEYCSRAGLSQGICVPVDGEAPACENNECPWPFLCRKGACELWCFEAECPTGMACVETRCVAAE